MRIDDELFYNAENYLFEAKEHMKLLTSNNKTCVDATPTRYEYKSEIKDIDLIVNEVERLLEGLIEHVEETKLRLINNGHLTSNYVILALQDFLDDSSSFSIEQKHYYSKFFEGLNQEGSLTGPLGYVYEQKVLADRRKELLLELSSYEPTSPEYERLNLEIQSLDKEIDELDTKIKEWNAENSEVGSAMHTNATLALNIKDSEKNIQNISLELMILKPGTKEYIAKEKEYYMAQEGLVDLQINALESMDNLSAEQQDYLNRLNDSKNFYADNYELIELQSVPPLWDIISQGLPSTDAEYKLYEEEQARQARILEIEQSIGLYECGGKTWVTDLFESGKKLVNEWSEGFSSLAEGEGFGELWDATLKTGATAYVGAKSLVNGGIKVIEYIGDGIVTIGGYTIAGLSYVIIDSWSGADTSKNILNSSLDFVNRDVVGELNKDFYEGTTIGQWLNEYSTLKYDSKGAQGLQNIGEFGGKLVLATAATVCTGGTAAPIVLGTLYGAGKGAEKYTQSVTPSEEYNFTTAGLYALRYGAQGAAEFYGYGQMGAGIIKALNPTSTVSASSSTSFLKNFATTDTILDTGAVLVDHGIALGLGEEKITDAGLWLELTFALGLNAFAAGLETRNARSKFVMFDDVAAPKGSPELVNATVDDIKRMTFEYESLLENPRLKQLMIDRAEGKTLYIPDDLMDSYRRATDLEFHIKIGKNIDDLPVTTVDDVVKTFDDIPALGPKKVELDELLDSNPELRIIMDNKAKGYSFSIPPEQLDNYRRATQLESEIRKSVDLIFEGDNLASTISKLEHMDRNDLEYVFDFLIAYNSGSKNGTMDFMTRLVKIYNEGTDAAIKDYNLFFQYFREHGKFHAFEVSAYAQKIASRIKKVDLEEVLYAAASHDFGMKGGYAYVDDDLFLDFFKDNFKLGKEFKINSEIDDKLASKLSEIFGRDIKAGTIADSKLLNEYFNLRLGSEYKLKEFILIDDLSKVFNNHFTVDTIVRKNHPLNSALAVLTGDVVPSTVDKDVVSLLAMSHSKSTSGIKHFTSQAEWEEAVVKLDGVLRKYNIDNGTTHIFGASKLSKNISENSDDFVRWQNEALAIRDGDAMAPVVKVDGKILMQDGTYAKVSYDDPGRILATADEEAEFIRDEIFDANGELVKGPDGKPKVVPDKSKQIHIGEDNVTFDSSCVDDNYVAIVYVEDPMVAPNSTFEAIVERMDEVNTYTNCESRAFQIALPKELKETDNGKAIIEKYEKMLYDKINGSGKKDFIASAGKELDAHTISDIEYAKQKAFYERIEIVYV